MIINRAHRYLFVEPPFTGSTAIATELERHYGGENILWKHAKYTEFRAQFGDEADEYFVFASNRNPLDQAVSEFVKLQNNHKDNFTTPEKFLRNGGYITDEALEEFHWVQENDASFADYFVRYKNKLFNNWYLLGHERFDVVIEFTRIDDEFDAVLRKIGLDPVRRLPTVNPTEGKKTFVDYYTPETWEQAFRCYGPFMRKWGYSFPAAWGTPRTSPLATARFHAIDRAVGLVSGFAKLDTNSRLVQRVKRLVQGG
ncbi:MAG: hypothetical protein MJB57_08455 [Gemmatimonadetes bacterium]|nr:hypothetical protein [Gemmatimonadota bacterium]